MTLAETDGLREWTRFAFAGWSDAAVSPPEGPPPAQALLRLGLGPLMFRLLRGRQDERAGAFAESHRLCATSNLLLVAEAAKARDALLARRIVPVLIKGGAFLLRHSPQDVGLRPMADFDLLVGPERFDEAFAVLTAAGWRRTNPELKYSSRVAPAITLFYVGGAGARLQVDLHRHVAQWPLLRTFPARLLAHAETVAGWHLCSVPHTVLLVALHRARHAFANDARDLFDLFVVSGSLDDESWALVVGEARELGLTGALYGAMSQAAYWYSLVDDARGNPARRVAALRARIGHWRARLLDRMADPDFALSQRSPWRGPLGRNIGVFPAALQAPVSSLAAAAMFLPLRLAETPLRFRRQ